MKTIQCVSVLALLVARVAMVPAQSQSTQPLVLTTSNAVPNNLLVYDTAGKLVQTAATGGQGGVSGNAGGIAVAHGLFAVVNFGSQNVSIFDRLDDGFHLKQVIPTASSPVSVAFGHDHLYVLGTTTVESHVVSGLDVTSGWDGVTGLVVADGSAAQVGVLKTQLILAEKSNAIETVNLSATGAVEGATALVKGIPSNVNTPFGLIAPSNESDEAYVTIAHSNEISLVRKDDILTITGSGTQNSPCWLALDGAFLFASNSPSQSVSRYLVYAKNIVQDQAVAATFNGDPTDISFREGLLAVLDGNGPVSHITIFLVDDDGNLTLKGTNTIQGAANGALIVHIED